jgi:hypothetical protein
MVTPQKGTRWVLRNTTWRDHDKIDRPCDMECTSVRSGIAYMRPTWPTPTPGGQAPVGFAIDGNGGWRYGRTPFAELFDPEVPA